MNPQAQPALGKGIKLHRDRDGSTMLLVPEGALVLNETAAAALELVDGRRSLSQIVATIVERFEVAAPEAEHDLDALFDRLIERGFIRL